MIADRILKAKEEIDRITISKAKLVGELESLMSSLKSAFRIRSLDEAKDKLDKFSKEMAAIRGKLEFALKSLESEIHKDELPY